jgi:Icc-related predicted phosphoesterase
MRIVAVADTHTFQADLGALPEGDVFVHAGDLLRNGTLDELAYVARWIRALPHATKIIVAGNHDWCFVREQEQALEMLGPEVLYLQDQALCLQGVSFYGSPWQPDFNSWAFNLPRGKALREKWQKIPLNTDVLITHGPPSGVGDRSSVGGRWGCEELRDAVALIEPTLHLFGHIHQDGGFWQRGAVSYSNVTTWECERGATVIDLNPETRAVTPVIIPAARRVL